MTNNQDTTAAEQFLAEKLNIEFSTHKATSYHIGGATIVSAMTEFAALESAKEAQRFAEYTSKMGLVWKELPALSCWFHKDDSLLGDGYSSDQIYNSEHYQLYKEQTNDKEGKG